VTAQDAIPIWPLIMLTVLPFLFHLLSVRNWPAQVLIPAAGMFLLACEIVGICRQQSPFDNEMAPFQQNLAVVLRLTKPTDLVMDGKGETIFRRRPTYWVMEGVTLRRMQMGLIPDDVKQKMIATATCVAVKHRLGQADQDWVRANYIEGDGKVWVAGVGLGPARPSMSFHTEFKARYSIVSDKGKLTGTIDGAPLADSQDLPAGDHRLQLVDARGSVAVVWTQALERGFSPFTKRGTEAPEKGPQDL
jgi:hypothetical protein